MQKSRHWETKKYDRWTLGEEKYYINLAIIIGDLATTTRTGVGRLVDIPALNRSPFELADIVTAQNPDVDVFFPWKDDNVPTDDDTYPFQVQKRQ